MRFAVIALALLAPSLCAAQTSKSSTYEGRAIDGWHFKTHDDSCSVIVGFTEKSSGLSSFVYVRYEAGTDTAWLGFGHDKFKSIEAGKEYEIGIKMIINDKLDADWGINKFTGVRDTGDKSGSLVGKYNGNELIRDIGKASSIGFYKNDDIITAFSLKGSASIMQTLRACGEAVEAEHPHDPFAK